MGAAQSAGRWALAALFVLAAGATVARTGAVRSWADERPLDAARAWPGHPAAIRSVAMASVGSAAAEGADPTRATLAALADLQAREPLAIEPLLVHSALAQRQGQLARAERLATAARDRDPRSLAARYLLADLYVRSGRFDQGLAEMTALSRLIPFGARQLVPSLADFVRQSGDTQAIRRLLDRQPELEQPLLAYLSRDPANTAAILRLHRPAAAAAQDTPRWLPVFVRRLVQDGRIGEARTVWATFAGLPAPDGRSVVDPQFAEDGSPPPFGWDLISGGDGLSERESGGLRIIYYGRKQAVLARQILLLPPGRYRLVTRSTGGEGLAWRIGCVGARPPLAELGLKRGDGTQAFAVPSGCPAQMLALAGVPGEAAGTVDARVAHVRVEPAR